MVSGAHPDAGGDGAAEASEAQPEAGTDLPESDVAAGEGGSDATLAEVGDAMPEARDAVPEAPIDLTLGKMLVGDWIGGGPLGDCIDISTWYSFGADGSVVNRDIDDNACTKVPRLLGKYSGRCSLTGRVLEMTLDGIGQDSVGAYPKVKVGQRLERFPIVMAVVLPPLRDAGRLALDRAYTSRDGAHFQSDRYALMVSTSSDRIFEQRVQLAVTVDPPLPLAPGTRPCGWARRRPTSRFRRTRRGRCPGWRPGRRDTAGSRCTRWRPP